MQVRLTTEADVERVMEIYHGAQAFMAAHGNPTQWRNAYPTPEIVREDIALQRGYVCEENGHLYAAFMLLEGEDPNYRRIDGAWLNDLPYQTLHRVWRTEGHGGLHRPVGAETLREPSGRHSRGQSAHAAGL